MELATQISRIQFWIECRDLPSKDLVSKSDPMVVVERFNQISKAWEHVGQTEFIDNQENPKFQTQVTVDYFFEEHQEFRFTVLDVDDKKNPLKGACVIGSANFVLAKLLSSSSRMIRKSLLSSKGKPVGDSSIIVHVEENKDNSTVFEFKLQGNNLDKKDFLGKSDPYFELHRLQKDKSTVKIYKSEVILNSLNVSWAPCSVRLADLVNGDKKRPFIIRVFDWDSNSDPDLIGEALLCLEDILENEAPVFDIYGKKKKKSGELVFEYAKQISHPTFVDYIKGGCRISLHVAVDFTGSNGDPRKPGTLHYIGNELNQYENAISSIGSIVSDYDSDQKFSLWGFGGKINGINEVNHCFALNFNDSSPEVNGVQGMLTCYRTSLPRIGLSGPTYLSEIIRNASAIASSTSGPEHQDYHILLILTDGVINDLEETISAIVDASSLPMSIIIAGIGDANFDAMNFLDSDNKELMTASGKKAERDIVQFVAFRDHDLSGSRLSKATLCEIPVQFMSYMNANGIKPNLAC